MRLAARSWPGRRSSPFFDRALQLDELACATWLGELAESQPNVAQAVRALLETAIAQFSNTVDPDHPQLLAARAELREATARGEHDQQHPER
jgi:uncharacterized protein involved in exopolysaccharide biosynthesis